MTFKSALLGLVLVPHLAVAQDLPSLSLNDFDLSFDWNEAQEDTNITKAGEADIPWHCKVTLPDETGGAFVDHTNHARKETVVDACKK